MTFPAGPLPTVAYLQDLAITRVPSRSLVFTHGGTDLDLTDPANGMTPCGMQFIVTSTAGNLVFQLAGDSSTTTMAVVKGEVITGAFVLISSTSTADGIVFGRH